jgi:hypothetical protein
MSTAYPVIRFDLDHDVRTVEAMASRLTPYIYETALYGPMPGDLPRLTVGGLLMRLNRLSAIANLLSPGQQKALDTARRQFDAVRQEWAVAYEARLTQELPSRLTALEQFIADCDESGRRCADLYPSEIEKRVIVEALKDEATARDVLSPAARARLSGIDSQLHRFARPADHFIWDTRLEPAYPRDKFWFLYVTPNISHA